MIQNGKVDIRNLCYIKEKLDSIMFNIINVVMYIIWCETESHNHELRITIPVSQMNLNLKLIPLDNIGF